MSQHVTSAGAAVGEPDPNLNVIARPVVYEVVAALHPGEVLS